MEARSLLKDLLQTRRTTRLRFDQVHIGSAWIQKGNRGCRRTQFPQCCLGKDNGACPRKLLSHKGIPVREVILEED